MKLTLKYFSLVVIFSVCNLPSSIIADIDITAENSLQAEQWELSRSGDALVKIPVINKAINQWSLSPQQRIELHYPGGEEGELWVEELRDGLVSLGVPSKNIVIVPGSGAEDVIRLYVVRTGESYK